MKCGLAITYCLFLAVAASGESVEVRPMDLQQSSRHISVSVSLNGKAVAGAKVNLCTSGDKPCFSVIAGDDGIARSGHLPDGNYFVSASIGEITGSDLYLHVSRKGKAKIFRIDLTESFRAAQDFLAQADQRPIRERLQVFQGFLRDPSGAGIPGADIKIMVRGSIDHAIIKKTSTDSSGYFSVALDDGMYVAFFSYQGFRTEIVPVEITPQGKPDFLVKLEIGKSPESIVVSAKR